MNPPLLPPRIVSLRKTFSPPPYLPYFFSWLFFSGEIQVEDVLPPIPLSFLLVFSDGSIPSCSPAHDPEPSVKPFSFLGPLSLVLYLREADSQRYRLKSLFIPPKRPFLWSTQAISLRFNRRTPLPREFFSPPVPLTTFRVDS